MPTARPGPAAVRAVLWDADGVLQDVPEPWESSMRPVVGHLVEDVDAFLAAAFAAERPALSGRGRWLEILPGLLAEWGIPHAYDDALRVWLTIEPVPETRAVVRALRARGIDCHLATNQDVHRGQHMHESLGYADLLDRTFYSYLLGAAKPEPAFFERVLEVLGLPAEVVLFVDDNAANVDTARSLGLPAVHWHRRDGLDVLLTALAGHGLPVQDLRRDA